MRTALQSAAVTVEKQGSTIVVSWTPELADLREVTARPAYRRQLAKAVTLAAVLLAAGVLLAATKTSPSAGVIAATAGAMLLLVIVLGSRRAQRLRWNSDPLAREPVEYMADERGLRRRQSDFEAWWDGRESTTSRRVPSHLFSGSGTDAFPTGRGWCWPSAA